MFDLDSYGKIVSFEIYPVGILGDNYRTVKIMSVIDYDTARLFSDISNTAVSVYPLLPAATPKDYKKYKYLKLEHTDGSTSCIAIDWINLDTVEYHSDVVVNIRLKLTNVGTVEHLRKLLLANNFTPLEITVE